MVATSWSRYGHPEGLFDPEERRLGIHAGDVETSMILALRPDLVRLDALAEHPSAQGALEREFTHLRAYGPHAFGWMATDLNPHGVTGNARQADLANGKAMIARAAEGFIELLQDVMDFDVTRFDRN